MQPYSLTITQNELLVVLRIFGVNTMNGLTDDPFEGLNERQIAERLNGGETTLLNRGLIQFQDDDTAVLDDALLAFVGASVFPDTALLLSEVRSDGTSIPHYFNATPELMVEHGSPRPGVYVFSHLPDSKLLQNRIQMLLSPLVRKPLQTAAIDLAIGDQLLADVLLQVRQNNPIKAIRLLEDAGWPHDAIQPLINDLATATIWTGVLATGLRDADEPSSQSLIVLQGATYCWLMEPSAPHTPEVLRARTVDGPACIEAFSALVEPMIATFAA